jgi:hypothetical protein
MLTNTETIQQFHRAPSRWQSGQGGRLAVCAFSSRAACR